MSKKTGFVIPVLVFVINFVYFDNIHQILAEQPKKKDAYIVQVPHVVLPETIQYKPYAKQSYSDKPATYTAYPSYQVAEDTEFRSIGQASYPVNAVSPNYLSAQTVAEIWKNRQTVPQRQNNPAKEEPQKNEKPNFNAPDSLPQNFRFSADNSSFGKASHFEIPDVSATSAESLAFAENSPEFVKRRGKSDSVTPSDSIAFIKRKPISENAEFLAETSAPLRLKSFSQFADEDFNFYDDSRLSQLERESFFNLPVVYSELVPPTQLNSTLSLNGFQQPQTIPVYGQSLGNPYGYAVPQSQYQNGGMFGQPRSTSSKYEAASGLTNVWNSYFGASQPRVGVSPQAAQYTSLTQLGGIAPIMSGQGLQPYGMPQYSISPEQMQAGYAARQQQQTIGYILLYPQTAQSGDKSGEDADGSTNLAQGENTAANNFGIANLSSMQAMFIPASHIQNPTPNYISPDVANPYQPNPYYQQNPIFGGINPYATNPYAMNPYMTNPYAAMNMNPYMMNPYAMNPYMMMNPMMAMGMGMTPPIIIQMPQQAPQRMGLFARIRARRNMQNNRYQEAVGSMASLFTSPERMPAKTAYPYGYFGATSQPYQSGYFGGYHDMYSQNIRFPGM
ncbi:MAG: hypothetical protein LBT05_01375 [Planctomycetaceae bacterium]|nr:hypothetical protein [Planctomycetaceae bacterium]